MKKNLFKRVREQEEIKDGEMEDFSPSLKHSKTELEASSSALRAHLEKRRDAEIEASSSSLKAVAVSDDETLQQFVVPFNLKEARERIEGFSKEYPSLGEEVAKLREQILHSEKTKKYANKEDVADFCISEILSLSKENSLINGERVFLKSFAMPNLVKSFAREAISLVTTMIKEVGSRAEDSTLKALLANQYFNGIGVKKNEAEAVKFFKLAANQGSARAQTSLAFCYSNGTGVAQNPAEAVRFYELAVEQGEAVAQANLGYCYETGFGVAKNLVEAAMFYRLAAEKGEAQSQFRIGYYYDKGIGVTKNPEKAAKFYKLAADQGHDQSQHRLGVCHAIGRGVAKDITETARLLRLAADQGLLIAQYHLGDLYANGTLVAKDLAEAEKFYKLAADQGFDKAKEKLSSLFPAVGPAATSSAAPASLDELQIQAVPAPAPASASAGRASGSGTSVAIEKWLRS